MNATAFRPTGSQVFPYDVYAKSPAKTYRVRIQPEEDADPSIVTVRTDFSLADLLFHIREQDCAVLEIRRGKGAWHSIN